WQSSTGRREATGSVTGVGHRFDGALQRGIDYRYDVYGNLTEQALDAGAVIESLQYDPLHRLTQTSRSGASSGQVTYGYDAAGNFQYKSDFSTAVTTAYAYSGGACGGGPNAVKSVQLKAGGSRGYCYDGAGNLISDSTGMRLHYDASQRPTVMQRGVADSQFRYGPDGDKARQWGSTGLRIYIAGSEDRPDSNETERYLGDYALITQSPSGRSVHYLLRDRLGSVIGVADDDGSVEWRGFDAFGAPRSGTWADKSPSVLGSTQTAHGFTQHEHLDGLGLIHMNGRVYDYALGRFLGVDPFIQFPGNSQSLNPYSYILNNPLAGTDPTGYAAEPEPGSICAVARTQCENVQGAADNGSPQGSGSSTRGGRRANGAAAGQKSTGTQGTSGGEASDTASPDGRDNAASGKGYFGKAASAFVGVFKGIVENYILQAAALNGDPDAVAELQARAEEDDFVAGFRFGVAIVDDAREGGPKAVGTGAALALTAVVGGRFAATESAPTGATRFTQTTASPFLRNGPFAGSSIGDVAAGLRSGVIKPSDLPVDVIVRNGETLALNSRSLLALRRAGIDQSEIVFRNVTGNPTFERILTERLARNGLDGGTDVIRVTGLGSNASNLE
ncbi:MAG: RHS repeat-associated core domain-containing protein, partial [Xanthomonadaceae bacterium]|nr:RHS repeat-associated core domain-containing protein [Xanthomonadaceae bacterium]